MLIIGLTGGIGSGKSTVTKLFSSHGVPIIDADTIARQVTAPGQPALREICALFGEEMIDDDGQLKRRQLRKIIFSNPQKRAQLEAILHPIIQQRMLEQAAIASQHAAYTILSIPLLLESGWQQLLDRILVIDVSEQSQLQRTMQRDNIDKKTAQAIINAQINRQDRLLAADDIIDNEGSIDELQQQLQQLHQKYLQLSHH